MKTYRSGAKVLVDQIAAEQANDPKARTRAASTI